VKILHINYTFGPGGGTEGYLTGLVRDLGDRDHESHVAAERDDSSGDAPFHRLDGVAGYGRGRGWGRGRALRAIVHAVNPDLIHVHNTLNADILRLASELRPTIRQAHDHTMFCPGLNKLFTDGAICGRAMGPYCLARQDEGGCAGFRYTSRRRAARDLKRAERLLRAHDGLKRIVVASSYMKEELLRVGVPATRVMVNPLYTEAPSATPTVADDATRSDEPNGPPRIAALGRMMHPEKGVMPLLDALAAIESPFRATLAGTGPHLEMLENHARKLGLSDRVEFPGYLAPDAARSLIARARVVAFPSLWAEPFGLVGIEALARGVPVVAFDVGGVREWLTDGETGMIVPRGDTDAFARALETLLTDADLAARYGRVGVDHVRARFMKSRHLATLEKVYREAAGITS
jgi:glycosyltransferase involved in cell wall biosynthesis